MIQRILNRIYKLKKYAKLDNDEIISLYQDRACYKPKRINKKDDKFYVYFDEPIIKDNNLVFNYVCHEIISTSNKRDELCE